MLSNRRLWALSAFIVAALVARSEVIPVFAADHLRQTDEEEKAPATKKKPEKEAKSTEKGDKEKEKEDEKKPRPAPPEGRWAMVINQQSATIEDAILIFDVKKKDDKFDVEVVTTPPNSKFKLDDLKLSGETLTTTLDVGNAKLTFEGIVSSKTPDRIFGCLYNDKIFLRSALRAVDSDKLKDPALELKPSEQLAEIRKLQQTAVKTDEWEKLADPARSIVKRGADDYEAPAVAEVLLAHAEKLKLKPEEVKEWVKVCETAAKMRGPHFERELKVRLLTSLATQEGCGEIAIHIGEKVVTDKSIPLARLIECKSAMATALEKSGKKDASLKLRAEIETMEGEADAEYLKKVPPFKVKKFEGRSDKEANKVAILELFTGVQCPPCVAADVAFDALGASYAPTELILLQYHQHIPGPDPLTNPDSAERFKYYSEKFSGDVGGTPATLFNGRPSAGGGGGMDHSEGKFDEYKKVIDELLKESTKVKIEGKVTKDGEKLTVKLQVSGLKAPSEDIKVRLVLIEDHVRYPGPNGVRIHHQLVRSMFDKPAGVRLKDLEDGKHEATLNIGELRDSLKKYLDEFAKEHPDRPFPRSDKPLDLKGLKVVALVQDDDGCEILAATQFDVPGGEHKEK